MIKQNTQVRIFLILVLVQKSQEIYVMKLGKLKQNKKGKGNDTESYTYNLKSSFCMDSSSSVEKMTFCSVMP